MYEVVLINKVKKEGLRYRDWDFLVPLDLILVLFMFQVGFKLGFSSCKDLFLVRNVAIVAARSLLRMFSHGTLYCLLLHGKTEKISEVIRIY